MKKKFKRLGSNAIDPATTTSKNWGFKPVPNKGGATTNFEIPEWMFKRELEDLELLKSLVGGAVNA